MAFTSGDIEEIKESGKWNIAKEYSEKKLLYYLLKIDEYQTTAEMGGKDLNEEFFSIINGFPIEQIRIKSLKWLIISLQVLVSNTKLAISPKAHKVRLKEIEKKLKKIKGSLVYTYKKNYNNINKTQKIIINEGVFNNFLEELVIIKEEVQEIINKNNLIYINVEEFSPGDIKAKIKKRAIEKG